MIRRLRLVMLVARPAVIILLAMFAGVGLAQAGHAEDKALLARTLVAVIGFMLFAVACNDLADERIDRVNLPGSRPLVTGAVSRREFTVIGVTAGVVAVAASATLRWPAVIVMACGLALSAGYSLRPVRLADRGAVASLALPACYVAVPYLTGIFAVRAFVRPDDVFLLAGLYLGFTGRILLKDFRDVRGDALFGKRTFLVRHGRRWTCLFSACCWLAGTVILLTAVPSLTAVLAIAEAGCLAGALTLLRALSRQQRAQRDEALITAVAIIGRGMILLLLAHLSMVSAGWSAFRYDAVIGMLGIVTAGQAASMVRHGPITRRTIPIEDQLAAHREILVRSTSSALTSSRASAKMARPA